MKDRLEDFVKKNRESFDVREPDPSLWLRINPENTAGVGEAPGGRSSAKSEGAGSAVRRLNILRYAAAVAVIFAGISAGIFYLSGSGSQGDGLKGRLAEEVLETELYYNAMVDEKYHELQPYFTSHPDLKAELDMDLEELDNIYAELKDDLKENIGNPEVIEAMIQKHRTKVEILEDLLNQLKETEKKDYEDEKQISL